MKMVIAGACISCITNVANDIPLSYKLARKKSLRVALKMGVVKDQLLVSTQLVNSRAATLALEEFNNLAVNRGNDRSTTRGRNIYGVMHASFRTRSGKGVL